MKFDAVDVLLFEPNPIVRRAIRDALLSMGIRNIVAVHNTKEMNQSLRRWSPDLLICDGAISNRASNKMTRTLRHGFLSENPFTVVLTTAARPNLGLVREVINSGSDSLIGKPLCMQDIIDRVTAAVELRKPFVVTKSYIGPDRRLASRDHNDYPLIDVPNSLQAKVDGAYDAVRMRSEIASTMKMIHEQKVSHDALRIGAIVHQILATTGKGRHARPLGPFLDELMVAASDIGRRLQSQGELEITALCKSLLAVTKKIQQEKNNPDLKDFELLSNLSQAIYMAYQPNSRITKFAEIIASDIEASRRYKVA